MKIARINMIEFKSEEELLAQQDQWQKVVGDTFPEAILQMGVQVGPTSVMSISLYPDQNTADNALAKRDLVFTTKADVMDGWQMEGPLRHFHYKNTSEN